MTGKIFFLHQPMQQAAVGAGFPVGEREIVRVQALEPVAMGQACHVIEQRAHPELFAAFPAQGEIDRRTGRMGCGRGGIFRRRCPIALDFFGQGRPCKRRIAALKLAAEAPKAAAILSADYYGWFERVERGIYALTPKGRAGLEQHGWKD